MDRRGSVPYARPRRTNWSSGASIFRASRSRSAASRSRARRRGSRLRPGRCEVVEVVAAEAPVRPERQQVARAERLADHRHRRAGHAVEHGAVVGQRQAQLGHARGPASSTSGSTTSRAARCRRAGARAYFVVAVDEVHLAAPDAGERVARAPTSPRRRAAAPASGRACGARRRRRRGRERREDVDAGRERVASCRRRRPARRPSAGCGRAARRRARPACPRCPSRRGSGRGRCRR